MSLIKSLLTHSGSKYIEKYIVRRSSSCGPNGELKAKNCPPQCVPFFHISKVYPYHRLLLLRVVALLVLAVLLPSLLGYFAASKDTPLI